MDETYLYHQIAEAIRKDILNGRYKSGDRLPSVRQLCADWDCTPGTVQRAYSELAREGLLVSRAGRGTQVAGNIPQARVQVEETLRKTNLVHRMEAVLLESLTAGYNLVEIHQAMELAMDRWRAVGALRPAAATGTLRFAGSHDPVVNDLVSAFFGKVFPEINFSITYNGSLSGLIALAEGSTEIAGCHLWDKESDTYNIPFIQRLLPGKDVTLVTLAHRRQGLIVAPGNPNNIQTLADLTRPGLRFVNRQSGSGTRVWLDAALTALKIEPSAIDGYADERLTHSDVARAVAEGSADAGLGLENAGAAFGLDFIFLNRERYDLVMLTETSRRTELQQMAAWLRSEEGRQFIASHPGYESAESGSIFEV